MARLVLKLENVVLREVALGEAAVTIGRLPENDIRLDDLAVSGYHAKIVFEGGRFVVYDENSTNGLYINGAKAQRAVLTPGDTVLMGHHIFTFEDGTPAEAAPVHESAPADVKGSSPTGKKPVALIRVLEGKTDQHEYVLTGEHIVIGRSETAAIRLVRWFAPKMAATIHRRGDKYYLGESQTPTPVRVNSEAVHGERQLEPGDTILVDDVTLVFNLQS
jgi:pSer/pThr/pTyr-binding forkhead associated (FHA) protein